jgi:hypothetical protein
MLRERGSGAGLLQSPAVKRPALLAGLIAVPLLGLAGEARAQTRPLRTEQAATAPAGSLVLEMGADAIGAEPNFLTGGERTRLDLPILRLVYSPSDSVEIDLEWVGRVAALEDPDFGDVSDWGDVSLRAKLRLREERPGRPGFGARFQITLPETSFGNGLGPNTLRMSAQLLASKSLGRFAVHGNLGLAIQDEPLRAHEQRDFAHYGLALTAALGERWSAVAEVAGLAGNGAPGADERGELRAGLRFGTGRLRGDAAVRRGLTPADGEWGGTVGLTWFLR